MKLLELLMRSVTHLNVGASIGMLAWLIWSGIVIVGDVTDERSSMKNECGRTTFVAATQAGTPSGHVCIERKRGGSDR